MTPPPAPAWIFFDVGETLVDETRAHLDRMEQIRAAAPAAAALSARALYERYAGFVVRRDPDPFLALITSVGIPAADRTKFAWRYELTQPFRDAAPAVRALRGLVNLGVLANQGAGLPQRLDGWWSLGSGFAVVLGSGDVGFKKPDPRIFAMALERVGAEPGACLYAGDRLDNDIVPPKAAGWRTAWVRRGLHAADEPRGPGERSDVTVGNLMELAALFAPPDRLRLAELTDDAGAVVAWPEKLADKRLVLSHLAAAFEPGVAFPEHEVNERLNARHRFEDHALLRRELVGRGYLTRDSAGREYRRVE